MLLEDLALVLLLTGVSHVASLPLLALRLPPIPAYIATGIALRLAGIRFPEALWENLVNFSLVFVGFHAGLSSRIEREDAKRVALASLINVLLSAAIVFVLLLPLAGSYAKAVLMSLLLANTATEGVLGLSGHAKYKADAEIALKISIGDDVLVLLLFTAALAIAGGQEVYGLAAVPLAAAGVAVLLSLALARGLDRNLLNAVAVAALFALAGLTTGSVGPLIGGYVVGLVLGSATSSGDPLLRTARHVGALADGLELVSGLAFLPLVFTYVGLRASVETIDYGFVALGLLGAVLGKCATVALLKRLGLIRPFSTREVSALVTVRGSLESLVALTALRFGLLSSGEFSVLVFISLMTYPASTALLVPARKLSK